MKNKEIKAFLKSIENKSFERRLFEMLAKIGEVLDGDLHVICTCKDEWDSETTYRVYMKQGYCFDAIKTIEAYTDDQQPIYDFQYYAEWEGFDNLRANDACIIIEKYLLTLK